MPYSIKVAIEVNATLAVVELIAIDFLRVTLDGYPFPPFPVEVHETLQFGGYPIQAASITDNLPILAISDVSSRYEFLHTIGKLPIAKSKEHAVLIVVWVLVTQLPVTLQCTGIAPSHHTVAVLFKFKRLFHNTECYARHPIRF
jgi:hypothetical protein